MNTPYVFKKCSKCGKWLVANTVNFNKAKGCKDGLRGACKICQKKYKKQYREQNKETIAKHNKQYREQNKEVITKRKKEYYKANKEAILEQHKIYREANKDKIKKKKKKKKIKKKQLKNELDDMENKIIKHRKDKLLPLIVAIDVELKNRNRVAG